MDFRSPDEEIAMFGGPPRAGSHSFQNGSGSLQNRVHFFQNGTDSSQNRGPFFSERGSFFSEH